MNNYNQNHHNNFKYDSVNEYLNSRTFLKKLSNDHLNIFQINMRSIRCFERFDIFKNLLDEFNRELDVVIISESWLDKYSFKYYNCIPDYEGFFDGRNYGFSGGGVAIFIKKFLNPRNITINSNDENYNKVWVEISNDSFGIMNIAGYYRPDWVPITDLLDNMQIFIDKFGHKNCFIGGDTNINILDANAKTLQYINLLNSLGFSISNNNVTRWSSGTLLDHAITNFNEKFKIITSTIDTDFSDHSIVMCEIHLPFKTESQTFYKNFTNFELFNINLVESLSEETRYSTDVNSYCNFITKSLNTSIISSTDRILVHKRNKDLLCPWINNEVKKLSNYKQNLIKKIKKCALNSNREILQYRLKTISSVIKFKKKILKQNYYSKLFSDCNNSHQTWKNINKVFNANKSSNSTNIKGIIDSNNIYTESNSEISQNFNVFYTSVAENMSNKIKSNVHDNINHFGSLKRIENSIFLFPSSPEEVQFRIKKLSNKKSPGLDTISVQIYKSCNNIIAPIISKLINLIFSSGQYPDALKVAKTIPIHKSGDPKLMGNYRPISLLNILNKIIEQIIHYRLSNFLNNNNFFL